MKLLGPHPNQFTGRPPGIQTLARPSFGRGTDAAVSEGNPAGHYKGLAGLATHECFEGESMAGYSGVDYIDFDSQLNDEEKLVRQTARQFVEKEVIPIIEKHSREGTFPMHLVPQLGELGFFGANLH